MSEKFRYRVTHPDYGAVEITAVDRLRAVSGAGVIWEVPWTSIARQCGCERLGPAADDDTSSDLAGARPPQGELPCKGKRGWPGPSPQGEGKSPAKETPAKKTVKKTAAKGKAKGAV